MRRIFQDEFIGGVQSEGFGIEVCCLGVEWGCWEWSPAKVWSIDCGVVANGEGFTVQESNDGRGDDDSFNAGVFEGRV